MDIKKNKYIEVAPCLPVNQTFTYEVEDKDAPLLKIGQKVLVPFGKQKTIGYITSLSPQKGPSLFKIKKIIKIVDYEPSFTDSMLSFFKWLSFYYFYPLGEVIKKAMPEKAKTGTITRSTEEYIQIKKTDYDEALLSPKKKEILKIVQDKKKIKKKNLTKLIKYPYQAIKELKEACIIEIIKEPASYKDPLGEDVQEEEFKTLTVSQKIVFKKIFSAFEKKAFKTFLLAGVTGSGKTEVYLHLVNNIIKQGFTALVLLPEIALISQIARIFQSRFKDEIAILHSALTPKEKFDQWLKIKNKEAKIVIGTRSSIFAPLENIGIIIVDEEHDSSYKQDSSFVYNARDAAVMRAKLNNAICLLGSATPSLQSLFNTQQKKFEILFLQKRIHNTPLPKTQIIDLKEETIFYGAQKIISKDLFIALKENLEKKEQSLIFLNRKGFASMAICASCGEAIKCQNCDLSLTYHKKINALKCHLCFFSTSLIKQCPKCGSDKIRLVGFGTEKIEEELTRLFPEANIARLDYEISKKKETLISILKDIKNNKIDIIIGTQILAKGHDFGKISLVGIVCADISLNFPDFRASETSFQVLSQVSGRAGRREKQGRVIMQTYNPNHFCIQTAQNQDFLSFYNQEIKFRKNLNYPPFCKMALLKISGKDAIKTKDYAIFLYEKMNSLKIKLKLEEKIMLMGTISAPISKISNFYRWQIFLKAKNYKNLNSFLSSFLSSIKKSSFKITVDIDPVFLL